ncbi:MAG: Peroxiredoxin Bcp [Chroococcopsis gigantea SAG 12.99]|jgi:peroxiredoxin Q/BCP|nr:redoxin domain-containing protein [Chlorogloea purpurea SAG 13.99]MDV2998642.1 Peroxiredoxin Bcp [Chroococcopsis gigantea SAG 12.99]
MSRRQFFSLCAALFLGLILGFTPLSEAYAMGGKQPLLNQPAPDFTLPSNTGDGDVSLADYRGKWVVLYFYPKDFTPGCTLEAQRFQKDLPKYIAKNAQILGVSADDVNSHTEFCDSEGLKYPLLADTKGEVSKAYGSWLGVASSRHTYIIDPEGILRERFLGVQPAIHSAEVLVRLNQLQAHS